MVRCTIAVLDLGLINAHSFISGQEHMLYSEQTNGSGSAQKVMVFGVKMGDTPPILTFLGLP